MTEISLAMFKRSATNIANPSGVRVIAFLRPYLWPHNWYDRGIVLFAFLMIAAARFLALAAPFFYKKSIDTMVAGQAHTFVLPVGFILAYGAARFSIQLTNYGRSFVLEAYLQRISDDLRHRFFAHLHRLSLRFHLERQTGSLTIMLARGIQGMRYLLENMCFNIIPTSIELVLICLALAKFYDRAYAGIIIVTVSIYIACTHWLSRKRDESLRAFNKANDHAEAVMMDSLINYETVKSFGKERHESVRFEEGRTTLRRAFLSYLTDWQTLALLQNAIITAALLSTLFLAAHGVISHQIKIGDYVLINTYLLQIFMPLGALGTVYIESKRSFVDMEAMLRILTTTADIQDAHWAVPLQTIGGEIRFENVCFGYDAGREILSDISFTVAAGARTAIVGATGAGKSTIAKLLCRYYDVTGGRILIDGQDIRSVTQSSLRDSIGTVPQDTLLFNDTIYYNIAYGASGTHVPEPTEVEEAAKLVHLHDFIVSLPETYETRVGERGLKLSGGEKQRIAIARTILKKPLIFLFDEATSALDNRTEVDIQARLREVAGGSTTLVIAHRLSTIVEADDIIVLDHGKIVEHGTHETLLAAGGAYALMWHRQETSERNGNHNEA